jgi:hypothetical protein
MTDLEMEGRYRNGWTRADGKKARVRHYRVPNKLTLSLDNLYQVTSPVSVSVSKEVGTEIIEVDVEVKLKEG